MINKIKNLQKGFTLIELLIVIAIIGVLSALLMSNFIGVRQRARDAQRKSDLRQIQSALELYRSDLGNYPATNVFPGCNSSFSNSTTIYMSKVPCDPNDKSFTGSTGNYYYESDSNGYTLVACLENASDGQAVAADDSSADFGSAPVDNCASKKLFLLNNP